MKFTIKLENGKLVRKGLEDLAAAVPLVSRQRMRTMMERVKRRMQEYPPEPEGQSIASAHNVLGTTYRTARGRYKRTGRLGRSWRIEQISDIGYSIQNDAAHRGRAYGRYVVGDAYGTGQAWMHKGRWQVLRNVVEEEIAVLPPEIERDLTMVARRGGL
jgi:hypothetical protein